MDLEGPWQNFQLFDVTDGVSEGNYEQLLVNKECERHIETQSHLIVYRQMVCQASKCGFLDKLGIFFLSQKTPKSKEMVDFWKFEVIFS